MKYNFQVKPKKEKKMEEKALSISDLFGESFFEHNIQTNNITAPDSTQQTVTTSTESNLHEDENENMFHVSMDFPELVELFPTNLNQEYNVETNVIEADSDNLFGENNQLFQGENWQLFDMPPISKETNPAQILDANFNGSEQILQRGAKLEEILEKGIVKEENSSSSSPEAPARKKQKQNSGGKKKKDLTPEELEQKKREQLEKRIMKNRRTADISRKRKKAKKQTLEESLKSLKEDSVTFEKQSIELNAENKVLKSEYFALLSLIQNTPKLSKMFDKISTIAVSQPPEKVVADTASAASVYLINMLYSIHHSWNAIKNLPPAVGQNFANSQIPVN